MISQLIINIVYSFSSYLLVSLSFTFLFYPSKFFNISQAALITLSAYIAFFFHTRLHLSIIFSGFLACAISFFIGLLPELIVFRKMRKKKFAYWSLMIASIGLYIVIQNIISIIFGDAPVSITEGMTPSRFIFFGAAITFPQTISVFLSFMFFFIANLFMYRTSLGKEIQAVSSNQEMSDVIGINSNKIILISAGIGTSLGAIAGIIMSIDTNLSPTMGFNLLLYGVVSIIIGGIGNLRGLIFGALLVASAQHTVAYFIDTKWMDAVTYIILILFLIWKPLGFSGNRLRKVVI